MKPRRAQTSIEFTILVGFLMVVFIIFFLIIQQNMTSKIKQRVDLHLAELARTVQSEIDLATESPNGYTRQFTLPYQIYGYEYEIAINENIISLHVPEANRYYFLSSQNVTGQLNKFDNVIRKENGEVKLNA